MPPPADGKRLSEVAICRIADIDRNRRRPWAERGLLQKRGRDGYSELDACELAVFAALVDDMDFDRAVEAWGGVRPALGPALMARPLLALYDEGRASGVVATDADSALAALERGGRFRVYELGGLVDEVRDSFSNAVAGRARGRGKRKKSTNQVQQLRSANPK